LRAVLLFLAMLPPAGFASAQDALRGKRLYLDGGRITGSGVNCVDCHGDVVGSAFGLGRAANNPNAIDYAINAIPQMTRSRGRYTTQDLADLAAYIGDPGVASPDLRLVTSGAAASAFTAERLDFGALAPGSASAPSTVRLVNVGQLPLRLAAAPALAGADPAQFELRSTDCRQGLELLSQQGCDVAVAFRPAGDPGLRAASVGVAHDWVGGQANVALIGRAAAAEALPPLPSTAAPFGNGGGGALSPWIGVLLAALAWRGRVKSE
jgi:hypothetical protein